jgi:hypothetical protein
MKVTFLITEVEILDRHIEPIDTVHRIPAKSIYEKLEIKLNFISSGDTSAISNKEILAYLMETLDKMPLLKQR